MVYYSYIMPSKHTKFYGLLLIGIDFFILALVFFVSYYVRTQIDQRDLLYPVYKWDYIRSFLVVAPVWIFIFANLGLYSATVYNRRLIEWARIGLGSFIGVLLVIGWEYATTIHIFPARLVAWYVLGGSILAVMSARELVRIVRAELYRYGRGVNRVLVIGNSAATRDIIRNLSTTSRSGYQVVAMAGPARLLPVEIGARHYSNVEDAIKSINRMHIDTIIQTDLYDSEDRNHKILGAAQVNHIQYNFIPGEPEFYTGKNTVDVFLGYPMITVSQTPLTGWGAIVKRVSDMLLSLILLIPIGPILMIIALLQKLLAPGPVFYISKRLSQFSQPVQLIKFRTMGAQYGKKDASLEFIDMGRPDLAAEYKKNRKVANDPRITRLGKFLRETSLDELPQIFNVIRGDLSLVGPRPILPQEVNFSKSRTALLHSVKSGVTGLWQVSGRSELSFDERIELELYYAQNWSFWLDLRILFKTVGVVLRKTGAK
jgi:exopolysaccharide biosynthesis polyprenyl glycosylphosphotransferase